MPTRKRKTPRTLGQVAFEQFYEDPDPWESQPPWFVEIWERVGKAVEREVKRRRKQEER